MIVSINIVDICGQSYKQTTSRDWPLFENCGSVFGVGIDNSAKSQHQMFSFHRFHHFIPQSIVWLHPLRSFPFESGSKSGQRRRVELPVF